MGWEILTTNFLTVILSRSVHCPSKRDHLLTITLLLPNLMPVNVLLMTSCNQNRLNQHAYVFVRLLALRWLYLSLLQNTSDSQLKGGRYLF